MANITGIGIEININSHGVLRNFVLIKHGLFISLFKSESSSSIKELISSKDQKFNLQAELKIRQVSVSGLRKPRNYSFSLHRIRQNQLCLRIMR